MNKKNTPLVSVTIPAYNQAHFLAETLDSVINQTYRNIEVIVLDDGSKDATPEVVKEYAKKDSRIHYFRQENKGVSTARNSAIGYSKGEYICMLESDDVMEKDKVELQLNEFLKDPKVDVVYTAVSFINAEGKFIGEMRSQEVLPENFLAFLFFRNPIATPSCMMAKRQCFIDNPYNVNFRQVDDYELTVRLAHKYRFKYLDKPLTRYRRHAQNISNDLTIHRNAEMRILRAYPHEHIEKAVDASLLSETEKTLLKGKIFYNLELFETSIPFFEKEGSAIACFYLGNIYQLLKNNKNAIEWYTKSLSKDPNNAACVNNLGVMYAYAKEEEKARAHFKKALELRPGYIDAADNLKNLESGSKLPFKTTFRELRNQLVPYQF